MKGRSGWHNGLDDRETCIPETFSLLISVFFLLIKYDLKFLKFPF